MAELSKDLLEFVALLNQKAVRYLVIGGWAVAFNGRPRYTKDIDILVEPTEENALRMLEVLNEFGFGSLQITKEDFLKIGQIIQLGYEPNRIDLITSVPAVDFKPAWESAGIASCRGVQIRFLGLKDLIANKSAVARPQDLADVDFLRKKLAKISK